MCINKGDTQMTKPRKTLSERIARADELGGRYLAAFNELDERGLGNTRYAETLLEKGQYWLDRSNKLRGCGE
jgi:hypothetical protein